MTWLPLSGTCPLCGAPPDKLMYLGLPMKLCSDERCSCLWGFWSFVAVHCQLNDGGWMFVTYDRYWPALWAWLTGKLDGEDEE